MAKLLDKMRSNPRGDWTIANVQTLCAKEGLECSPPSGGGSHWKVSHPLVSEILTIPAHRPIKPIYIRRLVAVIEKVRAVQHAETKKRKGKK